MLIAVSAVGTSQSEYANVHIRVCDTFGTPVSGAIVTLRSVGPNEKYTAVGGEVEFKRVKQGLYQADIRLAGFSPWNAPMRIYQDALSFRIGLELAPGHAYSMPILSGRVVGMFRGKSDVWARLIGLYTTELVETNVDASGRFSLAGMSTGKYLLILMHGDTVIATKGVDVLEGSQTLEVATSK